MQSWLQKPVAIKMPENVSYETATSIAKSTSFAALLPSSVPFKYSSGIIWPLISLAVWVWWGGCLWIFLIESHNVAIVHCCHPNQYHCGWWLQWELPQTWLVSMLTPCHHEVCIVSSYDVTNGADGYDVSNGDEMNRRQKKKTLQPWLSMTKINFPCLIL